MSLQRRLKAAQDGQSCNLFDKVHGYGWRLLNFGADSATDMLSEESKAFFIRILGGKCISVAPEQDFEGEYQSWFTDNLGLDHVVLIRPDFYVFGHAPAQEVNGLVEQLREMLGAA